jgi:hypothetical protein
MFDKVTGCAGRKSGAKGEDWECSKLDAGIYSRWQRRAAL